MRTLIFDFDGTIADNFFIAKDIFRTLVRMTGNRHPSDDAEIEVLRSLTARQVIARLKVHWWQLPYVLYFARKQMHKRQDEMRPIKGLPEVLAELHKRGHKLFIVSSNSQKNVQRFLDAHDLAQYFDGVYAGLGLFNKAGTLQKIVKQQRVAAEDCAYVGDEARDVDTARKAHMPCISVTWGYNNLKGLNRVHPETVINAPRELLKLVQ